MDNQPITLTIIRTLRHPRDTSKPDFYAYEYIARGGRRVDLRFKRDVDIRLFDGLTKFKATFADFNISTRYEYPRAYASQLVEGSIVTDLGGNGNIADDLLPD